MKYLDKIASSILSLALFTDNAIAGDVDVEGFCTDDTQCITFCCNNDRDFDKSGNCVEIESDERCNKRKTVKHSFRGNAKVICKHNCYKL